MIELSSHRNEADGTALFQLQRICELLLDLKRVFRSSNYGADETINNDASQKDISRSIRERNTAFRAARNIEAGRLPNLCESRHNIRNETTDKFQTSLNIIG